MHCPAAERRRRPRFLQIFCTRVTRHRRTHLNGRNALSAPVLSACEAFGGSGARGRLGCAAGLRGAERLCASGAAISRSAVALLAAKH